MRVDTGETYSELEYEEELRKLASEKHRQEFKKAVIRLPDNISEDSIEKLQKPMTPQERRKIINKLNRRRKKNKMAKLDRKNNRKRK